MTTTQRWTTDLASSESTIRLPGESSKSRNITLVRSAGMRDGLLILLGAVVGVAADRLWNPLQNVLWARPTKKWRQRRAARRYSDSARKRHVGLIGRHYARRGLDGSITEWKVVDVVQSMYHSPAVLASVDNLDVREHVAIVTLDPDYTLDVYDSYGHDYDTAHLAGTFERLPRPTDPKPAAFPKRGEMVRIRQTVETPQGTLTYTIDGKSRAPGKVPYQYDVGAVLLDGAPSGEAIRWLVRLGRYDLHRYKSKMLADADKFWVPEPEYCQHIGPTPYSSAWPRDPTIK